jgi:hypothetical protein
MRLRGVHKPFWARQPRKNNQPIHVTDSSTRADDVDSFDVVVTFVTIKKDASSALPLPGYNSALTVLYRYILNLVL